MFENITTIDLKILSLYSIDYTKSYSIREITTLLSINYSHAFKRVAYLVKNNVLLQKKRSQANSISFNIRSLDAIQQLSFVEEMQARSLNNPTLRLLVKSATEIDALACIGLFGSRASGKAKKDSDWDVFIICEKTKEMGRLMSKFPHITNIDLNVFSQQEFEESLLSKEETVVRHIVKNKQIIYNPHPFYNLVLNWEAVKYAPTS